MKKISIIAFLLLALQMQGQQSPQYTQYMYNMNVINPAYAGSRENISLGLFQRNQWSNISAAPQALTLFGHSRLGEKFGVGLTVISDQLGPLRESNAYADFSYTLDLGGEHRLALGIKAGATFYESGSANPIVTSPEDPFFVTATDNTKPSVGGGVFYYTNKYYLSLSMPNVSSAMRLDADGLDIDTETQHFYVLGGYVFEASQNTELKPSFRVRTDFDASTSVDLNLNARFYQKFEIGASYRTGEALSGLVNFAITPSVRIGYAYDAITSDIRDYAPASHEIMLLFDIKLPKQISRSPRYF